MPEITSGTIDSGANALINLSSAFGIGITIVFIIILAAVTIIIVYLWRVAPIRARREIETLKEEMLRQQEIKPPAEQHAVDAGINSKIKAIFAELDRIRARLDKVEGRCPQHQAMLNETLTNMKVINETLPQALESISSLSDKVWEIAMRRPGAKL